MQRSRLPLIIGIVVVLGVCVLCAAVGTVWYSVPRVMTAVLGPQPTAFVEGPSPTAGAGLKPAPTEIAPANAPATETPEPAVLATPVTPPARDARPTAAAAPPVPTPSLTPAADIVARLESAQLPARDLFALTQQLKKVKGPIPRVVRKTPEPHKVGDKAQFWVNDQDQNKYYQVTATLRYIAPNVYMWVEDGVDASDDAIKRSADIFSSKIYPTDRQIFGEEASPGIDGDKRLYILNGKLPGSHVGGYFSSADTYPTAVNQYSNQHEMFYINTAAFPIGSQAYEATLAHEFQHMIHQNHNVRQTSWINEGFSELAAQINGYGPSQHTRSFLANPNLQLTAWSEPPNQYAHYGAGYLFATYLYDRFGADFIKDVVADQNVSIGSIDDILKKRNTGVTFEQVFQDWLIANYLDNPKLANGRYGYPDVQTKLPNAADLTAGQSHDGQVAEYGAEYLRLSGPQPLNVHFQGQTAAPLIPTTAHSGEYMMWSNRGDNIATSMSRAFDLTGVKNATLQFATWYDIEEDWDYGYVEVSTDNGQTWDLLKTTHATDTNPNGNAFGPGLTGQSGGEKNNPQWVEESANLTPYAGKKILIRFQQINDDAVNLNGFAVDDIRIPELKYSEDFEKGDGGWKTDGWVRTNGVVPQRYLVQLIEMRGDNPTVREIPIGPDGRADFKIDGMGTDFPDAILVVAGAAPVTTQTTAYSVKVDPQ
ncbi:MAG: immune inhibitor A [Anaerolineae bacterium]